VGGDPGESVTFDHEAVVSSTPPYRNANVAVRYSSYTSRRMVDSVQSAHVGAGLEICHSACKCGNWTDGSSKSFMVDDRSLGAILGVGNANCCTVRLEEGSEYGGVQ
jgi:hypothetical protein